MDSENENMTHYNKLFKVICSDNVVNFETLIDKFAQNDFKSSSEELQDILSKICEKLELQNIPLSNEMKISIKEKIVDWGFFSDSTVRKGNNTIINILNIKDRIDLVLKNIDLLCAKIDNVDEEFLFLAKFIAQNIHILKRQLRSTYCRVPWEEIEFCLVAFIFSHTRIDEINLFYRTTLSRKRLLKHLENFANGLRNEINYIECTPFKKLTDLPRLKREFIVAEIIKNFPNFESLFSDFQEIKDIHSLNKIHNYIILATSVDPKKREGVLVIMRSLQVIGELLKNTLESPNLSTSISDILLLLLPASSRKVLVELRNSLSHADSLLHRIKIEKNASNHVFEGIQNDLKKIGNAVFIVLCNNKTKVMKVLVKCVRDCKNVKEFKEYVSISNNIRLDQIKMPSFATSEYAKLETLVKDLDKNITEKTIYEVDLLNDFKCALKSEKERIMNAEKDFVTGYAGLLSLLKVSQITDTEFNSVAFKVGLKSIVKSTLFNMPTETNFFTSKSLLDLAKDIYHTVKRRMNQEKLEQICCLIMEVLLIAELGKDNVKWIEELNRSMKVSQFYDVGKSSISNISVKEYQDYLALRLSELETILGNHKLSKSSTKFSVLESNPKVQSTVEMLVLDILAVLNNLRSYLSSNLFFLDKRLPLLLGKNLRNYLAHGDILIDTFLSDSLVFVILNARKLTSSNIEKNKRIGQEEEEDLSKLVSRYNENLSTILSQKNMFAALENGSVSNLKRCIENGANIFGRNIHLQTALHFAAKATTLDCVKYLLNQNLGISKDVHGQSPLHIACTYGNANIVEFFIKNLHLNINDVDESGQTPLHIAAQYNRDSVISILLKYGANKSITNQKGHLAVNCAIDNNNVSILELLLSKNVNVDHYEAAGGFTLLHQASECGSLDAVRLLLQKGANVNAKNDRRWTPLHAASSYGYPEIVKILILHKADIFARVINGRTALHYAAKSGHEDIITILLENGVDVNISDENYNITPLHCAVSQGQNGVVNLLLKHNCHVNISDTQGITPLHVAAQEGFIEIVDTLLKHNASVYVKTANGCTPLLFSAQKGNNAIIACLMKKGADINAQDDNGFAPIHVTAAFGYEDVIYTLIKNKANINITDKSCQTALHIAAAKGLLNIVSILVHSKCSASIRDLKGSLPLHVAAYNGHKDVVKFLLQNTEVNIDAADNAGFTSLHMACTTGYKGVVNSLIENGAKVNTINFKGLSALHSAVRAGNKDICVILIKNKANVNMEVQGDTPLSIAIMHNFVEIAELLIRNGAKINIKHLTCSIQFENEYILNFLLRTKNLKELNVDTLPLLYLAAKIGNKEIVSTLILNGVKCCNTSVTSTSPLLVAVKEGHEEIVEILLQNGFDPNCKFVFGATPLLLAIECNYVGVVSVLLKFKANVNLKDEDNRTPLEMAVGHNRVEIVKLFLQCRDAKINAKGNDDYTLLHIASQEGNLEIVKLLINKGIDIHAKIKDGQKALHIAARRGFKNVVQFMLEEKFYEVDDTVEKTNCTSLHYASMGGHADVVKCLIECGADVNFKNVIGWTPLHISTNLDVVKVLIENGAIYNACDNHLGTPSTAINDTKIVNCLKLTDQLFIAVKNNAIARVKDLVDKGAFINAKDTYYKSSLHYAAMKGHNEIILILLQNGCNANIIDDKGSTPLHYAAKLNHSKVVEILLSKGAIYNKPCKGGKIPLNLATHCDVISLLKLVDESFKNIQNGNSGYINTLNKIKDINVIKVIMNARNKEGHTLIVAAVRNDFPRIELLKQIHQGDVSTEINKAMMLAVMGNKYEESLNILEQIFKKRKEILGPDNPATLEIQISIAKILHEKGSFQESLNILRDISTKQKESLGLNNESTLNTISSIGYTLHKLGKNEEALHIFEEVFEKQKNFLGPNHLETLATHFHMALVLDQLERYEEALAINRDVYEKDREILGASHPTTLSAHNNIALVLMNQENYKESLEIFEQVLALKKSVFGVNNSSTLRTMFNIAVIYGKQKKHQDALKVFNEVLSVQKKTLGPYHPDVFHTQHNIALILSEQGKWNSASTAYKECLNLGKIIYGETHPLVFHTICGMEEVDFHLKFENKLQGRLSDFQIHEQNIHTAVNKGDIASIQHLLKNGTHINDADGNGRTLLHFSTSNGNVEVVNFLLKNGASVNCKTTKGNTPLHIATLKDYVAIVEILLQRADENEVKEIIDAQTSATGTTALHIAAKNGSVEIASILLKYGANCEMKNKDCQTPLDVCSDDGVSNLLKLLVEFFEDIEVGRLDILKKLKALKTKDFPAFLNARNHANMTLLQVATITKQKIVAKELLKMLRSC